MARSRVLLRLRGASGLLSLGRFRELLRTMFLVWEGTQAIFACSRAVCMILQLGVLESGEPLQVRHGLRSSEQVCTASNS